MTILDFLKAKEENKRISMITCYDSTFARIINSTEIDSILIGDSCAMLMHGENSTIPAQIDWLVEHTRSVRNGAPDKFILADMPFLSTRKGIAYAAECAGKLLIAGANSVKIEGVFGQEDVLKHLILSGIPVMAHLGLTPQFYNSFGGHKMQGKTQETREKIIEEAKIAEKLGCYAILLECIPSELAKEITNSVKIPTIGIGAGLDCTGQVLVLQDMLGMTEKKLRFVRKYLDGFNLIQNALNQYDKDVKNASFPAGDEIR